MTALNKKVKQGQQTAQRLVQTARRLFAQHGYAGTSTQMLISQLGITKGALYHHFPSKTALFEAVYLAVEDEMGQAIGDASARARTPWRQLLAGCECYLEYASHPANQQILRIDGPAVLGQQRWAQIDRQYGYTRLLPFLQELARLNVLQVASVPAFAQQLTGAMNEATFWISQADHRAQSLRQSKRVLQQLLEGVRGPG